MRAGAAIVALAACGAPAPAHPRPPTLADLGWLAGTWHAPELDSHWQNIDGALYGVALDGKGFEVNIIDDSDEDGRPAPITLTSLVNGKDPMTFALVAATPAKIELADAQHRVVRVTKVGQGWRGDFEQPGEPTVGFTMAPGSLADPPELEAADRAFAADTAKDGADGWMAHFAPDGALWRKGGRIEGDAIRAALANTLAKGPLRWQPVASGARDNIGFTLGTYTFGSPAIERGSYVTIWNKQSDGAWKVVFDTGRPGG